MPAYGVRFVVVDVVAGSNLRVAYMITTIMIAKMMNGSHILRDFLFPP